MTVMLTSADGNLSMGPPERVTIASAVFSGVGRGADDRRPALPRAVVGEPLPTHAPRARRARDGDVSAAAIEPSPSSAARLVRSSAAVALGTLLSRVTGLVRVAVLAFAIGQATLADTYNLANTTPNIVYELLVGGVLSATLVPVFVDHLQRRDDRSTSAVFTVTMTALVALTADRDARRAADRPAVLARRLGRAAGRAAHGDDVPDPLLPAADVLLRVHRAGRRVPERPPAVRRRRVRAGAATTSSSSACSSCSAGSRPGPRRTGPTSAASGRRRAAAAARPGHHRRHRRDGPRARPRRRACRRPSALRVRLAQPGGPHDAAPVGLDGRLRRHEPDRAAVRARARRRPATPATSPRTSTRSSSSRCRTACSRSRS